MNVKSEEFCRSAKVADLVMFAKFGDNPVDFLLSLGADESIINVGGDDDPFISRDIHAFISVRGNESKFHEFLLLIVSVKAAGLFETVQSFVDE